MCIIAYKPAGAKFPTKKQYQTMFKRNPDGCGFMFADGNNVIIKKGFMTYSEFRNALAPYSKMTDKPFIFHFRIATHGGINEAMTQPFPLTNKNKRLRSLDITAPVGIAHNGIIPITDDARGLSDTAQFIRDYMTRICTGKKPFDDINLNIIEACIDSRMVILEASGAAHVLGYGWSKDSGIWYSNTSYQDYTPRKTATKTTTGADFWSDYDYSYSEPLSSCDGYCSTCQFVRECWDTDAAIDRGINSI